MSDSHATAGRGTDWGVCRKTGRILMPDYAAPPLMEARIIRSTSSGVHRFSQLYPAGT